MWWVYILTKLQRVFDHLRSDGLPRTHTLVNQRCHEPHQRNPHSDLGGCLDHLHGHLSNLNQRLIAYHYVHTLNEIGGSCPLSTNKAYRISMAILYINSSQLLLAHSRHTLLRDERHQTVITLDDPQPIQLGHRNNPTRNRIGTSSVLLKWKGVVETQLQQRLTFAGQHRRLHS